MSNSNKLISCFHEWKALTNDDWVLSTVQGYTIPFDYIPVQTNLPKQINFSKEEEILVDLEVKQMLEDGGIEPSIPEDGQFVSNIFLRQKSNGKFRPIINLKKLNESVVLYIMNISNRKLSHLF